MNDAHRGSIRKEPSCDKNGTGSKADRPQQHQRNQANQHVKDWVSGRRRSSTLPTGSGTFVWGDRADNAGKRRR